MSYVNRVSKVAIELYLVYISTYKGEGTSINHCLEEADDIIDACDTYKRKSRSLEND
jgi:hypothetical protein